MPLEGRACAGTGARAGRQDLAGDCSLGTDQTWGSRPSRGADTQRPRGRAREGRHRALCCSSRLPPTRSPACWLDSVLSRLPFIKSHPGDLGFAGPWLSSEPTGRTPYITFGRHTTKRGFMCEETMPGIVGELASALRGSGGWVSLPGCSDEKRALAPTASAE